MYDFKATEESLLSPSVYQWETLQWTAMSKESHKDSQKADLVYPLITI